MSDPRIVECSATPVRQDVPPLPERWEVWRLIDDDWWMEEAHFVREFEVESTQRTTHPTIIVHRPECPWEPAQ